jgi:outer membrane lipoprotein-sorting protein
MKKTSALEFEWTKSRTLLFFCLCMVAISLSACGEKPPSPTATAPKAPGNPAEATSEGQRIIEQYRTLDKSRDSFIKMEVKIQESDGQNRDVILGVSNKREADGRRLMFSEFLSPAEERDRNALIAISPQGEIEGTRYIQSNDSFATVKGATNEDSFFGLTIQEMVDGQPEKYDFKLLGEETVNAAPAYRLEGTLKKGADSRFPRVVMLLAKDNYTALAAEFYDSKNELVRRVNITKSEQINGNWIRTKWTMDNLLKMKKLDFEIKEVKFNQNFSNSVFTREHLKKTSTK